MLLAIDTSGKNCAAALADKTGHIITSMNEELGRGHAERLMPMLDELMANARIEWTSLSRIAVVRGPGSFTGLRAGLAAAKGFALALGIPCQGVSVFEAMHYAIGGELTVCLDAKRGQIWCQNFSASGPIGEPQAHNLDQITIAEFGGTKRLCGSGSDMLDQNTQLPPCEIIHMDSFPEIKAVTQFAFSTIATTHPPDPLYLRAPDAKPQKVTV